MEEEDVDWGKYGLGVRACPQTAWVLPLHFLKPRLLAATLTSQATGCVCHQHKTCHAVFKKLRTSCVKVETSRKSF